MGAAPDAALLKDLFETLEVLLGIGRASQLEFQRWPQVRRQVGSGKADERPGSFAAIDDEVGLTQDSQMVAEARDLKAQDARQFADRQLFAGQ
jgi:hypothetical protein